MLQDLKSAVKQTLSLLPTHALVGLITFGQHVYVHELGHEAMPKAVMLRRTAEIDGAKAGPGLACSSRPAGAGLAGHHSGGCRRRAALPSTESVCTADAGTASATACQPARGLARTQPSAGKVLSCYAVH